MVHVLVHQQRGVQRLRLDHLVVVILVVVVENCLHCRVRTPLRIEHRVIELIFKVAFLRHALLNFLIFVLSKSFHFLCPFRTANNWALGVFLRLGYLHGAIFGSVHLHE